MTNIRPTKKNLKESKEINLIDNVANKLRKITDAYVDTYRGADWISLGKDEYTIKIIYMRNELSIELYKDGDFKDGELEYASSLSDDDFSVNYVIDFIKNFIKNRNYLKNKFSIKESKKITKRSLKESKHSIKFEDFVMLNNEPIDEFKVYVNNICYGTLYKKEIGSELLSCDVVEWCSSSAKGNKIIVWLE